MKTKRWSLTAFTLLAGLAILGAATPARAALTVSYTTLGTFTGPNATLFGAAYDDGAGIHIDFEPIIIESVMVNPPPASGLSFGNFNTILTTATTLTSLVGGFDLEIFQAIPSPTMPASLTLIGTLHGELQTMASTAFVQFTGFTPAVVPGIGDAGFIGTLTSSSPAWVVSYFITEADSNTLGRANIVSPSVNKGVSSIEGAITATAVPEPSAVAMMATAILPFGLLMLRRRTKVNLAG